MIEFKNEDCIDTMQHMVDNNIIVDLVLTSPPYNTSRKKSSVSSKLDYSIRYDICSDNMPPHQYREWCVKLFNTFDKIIMKNGVVLWNMSYSTDVKSFPEYTGMMWGCISDIIDNSNFTVVDKIVWKKKSAMPNNISKNKLTRITEDVFVFCRKSEQETFFMNKPLSSVKPNGQKMYSSIFNFIEAPNNSEVCTLNKATYSIELCEQLLELYAPQNALVYDPFNGSGTTGIACELLGLNYIGSEISEDQVKWSIDRLNKVRNINNLKETHTKVNLF